MKLKIKKGDTVEVISGAEKGKKGTVLGVDKKNLKIRVQGVRVQTHFDKKEGILKKEGVFDYSKVKFVQAAAAKGAKKKKKASASAAASKES